MMVCKVPFHRFEEPIVGRAFELCPTLAVRDPSLPFADRCHLA
jgi:hypothetical protein